MTHFIINDTIHDGRLKKLINKNLSNVNVLNMESNSDRITSYSLGCEQLIQDAVDDEDVVFFMDYCLEIKDWSFPLLCNVKLNQYKFIANGVKQPTKSDYQYYLKFVKDETKHIFDSDLTMIAFNTSFFCTQIKHLKNIGFFEIDDIYTYINNSDNALLYKINRVYGGNSIGYLGNKFNESDYIENEYCFEKE